MRWERCTFQIFHYDDFIMVVLLIGLFLCATHVEGGAIAQDMSVSELHVDRSFSVSNTHGTACDTRLRQVFNILFVGEHTILLGSTDCLYALDKNLMYIDSLNISADQTGCKFGINNDIENFICKNYFTFGFERNSSWFHVCGTYRAQYPRCWECSFTSGKLSCDDGVLTFNMPRDPVKNYTILMSNDKFYVGGSSSLSNPAEESPKFSTVNSSSGEAKVNTSSNNLWLNAPKDFVGDPIEYKDHVYFFYREKAEENTIENRIYSRVARVCKNDAGGFTNPLTGEFTTFLKTRLLCTRGQLYPAMYDEIQDVEQSTYNSTIIYALFTTPNAGMVSSAICRYSLSELKELFDSSDRRGQPETNPPTSPRTSSWQRITRDSDDTVERRQCRSSYPEVTSLYDHLEDYPLMNDNALNCAFSTSCDGYSGRTADDALAILEGIAGQRLALKSETDSDIVVYVGTNNPTIYRVEISDTTANITQNVKVPLPPVNYTEEDLATKWPYGISDLIISGNVVYGTIDDSAFSFLASEPIQRAIVSISEDMNNTFPASISSLVQINIFKVFEAPEGSEITASLSGELPNDSLMSRRFNVVAPSGNKEVLHCTIKVQGLTGSITDTLTVTSMTSMGLTLSIPINITYDASEQYVPQPGCTDVNEYDKSVAIYKYEFKTWLKNSVNCTELGTCPGECP